MYHDNLGLSPLAVAHTRSRKSGPLGRARSRCRRDRIETASTAGERGSIEELSAFLKLWSPPHTDNAQSSVARLLREGGIGTVWQLEVAPEDLLQSILPPLEKRHELMLSFT